MILTDADELREALRMALQERDEARAERDAVQRAMLGYAVFIGPCAHEYDPWDRCDECAEDNALWAATKAVTARTKERDEARVEVKRLRRAKHTAACVRQSAYNVSCVCGADEAVRALLQDVAERQRKACAASAEQWQQASVIYRPVAGAVRATPLVTEVDSARD
jgi:hypothetical protein